MQNDIRLLDIDSLKELYVSETDKLKTYVLSGATWEQVQQQRHRLIHFETVLHQKMRFSQTKVSRFQGR